MNLIQGAHDVQVQHGEGEYGAEVNLSVDEKVDGEGEHQDVEEALVQCLTAAEQRHFEVMPDLLGSLALGRASYAADFLAVCVGGPHVVDPRQLFNNGTIHRLACSQ